MRQIPELRRRAHDVRRWAYTSLPEKRFSALVPRRDPWVRNDQIGGDS